MDKSVFTNFKDGGCKRGEPKLPQERPQKVKEGLYTKLVGKLRIIKSCKEQRDIDTFCSAKFGYQPAIFGVLSSYKK